MSEPIKVSYQWTVKALLKAQRWHWRNQIRPIYRLFFWVLGICLVWAIVGFLLKGSYMDAMVTLGIILYSAGMFYIWWPWYIRRQFLKRPDKDLQVEWLIDADKIRAHTGLGGSEVAWKLYVKVVQTPAGFLFYIQPELYHWLPREGFVSEEDVLRLAELAKSNATKFARIK